MKLYDGVLSTLRYVHEQGTTVVAYTDAHASSALERLCRLDLTNVISKLYAPQHDLDGGILESTIALRNLANDYIFPLSANDRKPNPQVLIDISNSHNVRIERTLYVGDSLVRDIYMANRAGAHSSWAKYGTDFDQQLWRQLVRVTHWTEKDVIRENELRSEASNASPEVTLLSFSDILDHFSFSPETIYHH